MEHQCITCKQVKDLSQYTTRHKNRTRNGTKFVYIYTPKECSDCENKKRQEYGKTPAGKTSGKRARQKYYGSEKGQIVLDAYWKSPRGKATHKRYNISTAGHERNERYNKSDKGEVTRFKHSTRLRPTSTVDDPYSLTAGEWTAIKAAYGNHCAYCGKLLRDDVDKDHADYPNIDHVIPISRGGQTTKENVVPACRLCNYRKGKKRRIPISPQIPLPWISEKSN